MYKSGFVSIVGRPNVGKSTLLNKILGQKITIMSNKAQTTRNTIQGVYTTDSEQIVFIDTPGIHKPKHALGKYMTDVAINTFKEVDIVLFVINASEVIGPGDKFIIELLKNIKTPVFLVINQIDKINKEEIFDKIVEYKDLHEFKEIIPISAKEENNIDKLLEVICQYIEEGPQYYPTDQVTNYNEKFIISEFIREKVLFHTEEEVPHSVAVVIDSIEEDEEGRFSVLASIIVERDSQKGIMIGARGSMLKKIGTSARRDISRLLGAKIYLELFVKVEKNWRNKNKYLQEFGYGGDEY